jgi:hypothetical protein
VDCLTAAMIAVKNMLDACVRLCGVACPGRSRLRDLIEAVCGPGLFIPRPRGLTRTLTTRRQTILAPTA